MMRAVRIKITKTQMHKYLGLDVANNIYRMGHDPDTDTVQLIIRGPTFDNVCEGSVVPIVPHQLTREKSPTTAAAALAGGGPRLSDVLLRDLEEVRRRLDQIDCILGLDR